jgi:hypothetical protein
MASSGAVVCTRCRKEGHAAKDCKLPFLRSRTLADERAEVRAIRLQERAQARAEWEAREAKREKKRAEWEARQAEDEPKRAAWEARRAQRKAQHPDWETCSQTTDASTAATATALSPEDEEELERRVAADKAVRRHEKTLREIAKLEGRGDLDALQRAKLERREDVEEELSTAKGRARAVAKNELRLAAQARAL